MKVAASTCVLPPQLGRELGLPTSQSTVSALGLDTRVLGQSTLSTLPHTISACPVTVAAQKEGTAPLQDTDKMSPAVHNRKARPREGCGQGRWRKNTISQAWEQPLSEL